MMKKEMTKDMQDFTKTSDPKYYLNQDAVMQDIENAFTMSTAPSQSKNSHLKMRAKAMRAQNA